MYLLLSQRQTTITMRPTTTFSSLISLTLLVALQLLCCDHVTAWSSTPTQSRRDAMASMTAGLSWIASVSTVSAEEAVTSSSSSSELNTVYQYELRDRKSNKDAIIREDFWYMLGRTPPKSLTGPLKLDDPQWNTFGTCETSEGGGSNSCTYVSLKQRIPAYSKYAFSIGYGAQEYKALEQVLKDATRTNSEAAWNVAARYVTTVPGNPPPPTVDALLKMVLFASAMLTSPNYSGPTKEILVARFYVNELGFATKEIAAAIQERDGPRALAAWDFGKESWNSYYQVVNGKIVPKVGDKFEPIV